MNIEGLHVIRNFLNLAERKAAMQCAKRLTEQAAEVSARQLSSEIVSKAHNINSREVFKSLQLRLDDGRTASCEHFSKYGEGHLLTYFRGEIPSFVPNSELTTRLLQLPSIRNEVMASRKRFGRPDLQNFKWRLTLNYYPTADSTATRFGFPWHRDLVANGASTMILNLGAPGCLEFGEEPLSAKPVDGIHYGNHNATADVKIRSVKAITLEDGDLLALTGPARWEYLHRVAASKGGKERVTLVYGVW